jgi:hypothetical protein
LKPTFNKSGQSWISRHKVAKAADAAGEKWQGRVMATINSASLSSPAGSQDGQAGILGEIRDFWRQFIAQAFDPYRPELHYMRGPGPACRAKQARS